LTAAGGGAYYLAGYAVELALKACVIKTLMMTDAFPDREFSRNCYTHDLAKLAGLAKLGDALKAASNADPPFAANWAQAIEWSEEKRYHRIERAEADMLYTAVADIAHGVFPWIQTQW